MATATATAGVSAPAREGTPWWLMLLEGIALILTGVLLFTDADQTVFTLVLFIGIWWFISGIFDLVSLFMDRTQWGWKLASGILGIVAGLAIVRHPYWAALLVPATLVWVVGLIGVVVGIIGIIRAFQGAGWGIGILGAISIILGVVAFGANLGIAVATAIFATAIWAVVGGVIAIVYGFRLRSA
jgi:uncharacterized membrane protein HdeD (DUF308 family)